ncbi:MAG: hypothetical protein ACXQS8_04175, partial [Candidatus Helarchaeales archaeon]
MSKMKEKVEKVTETLQSEKLFKTYVVGSAIYLCLTLIFIGLGLIPNYALQTVAGIFQAIAFIIIFAQVLLVLWNANRDDTIGHRVLGFAYITLAVMVICSILIVAASFLNSFYPDPRTDPIYAPMLSIFAMGICFSFGLCLSMVCYIGLSENNA